MRCGNKGSLFEIFSEDLGLDDSGDYEPDVTYDLSDDISSLVSVADEAEDELFRWAGVNENDPHGQDLLWDIWSDIPNSDVARDIENNTPWSSAFIVSMFLRAGRDFPQTAQHKEYMLDALENRRHGSGAPVALRPDEVIDIAGLVYVTDRGSGSTFESPGEKNHADISLGDGTAVGGNLSDSVNRVNVETDQNGRPISVGGKQIIMVVADINAMSPSSLYEIAPAGPSIGTGRTLSLGRGASSRARSFGGDSVEASLGVDACWNTLGIYSRDHLCNFDAFIVGGVRNYRSAKPGNNSGRRGAASEEVVLRHLKEKWGIARVIDLDNDPDEESIVRGLDLGYIPSDGRYTKPDATLWGTMKRFLSEGNTLIHCTYGADRTGAYVARYKVENGMSAESATAEAVNKYSMDELPANSDLHAWIQSSVRTSESIAALKMLIREIVGQDIDISAQQSWSSYINPGGARGASSYQSIGLNISGDASDISTEYDISLEEAQEIVNIGNRLQTNPGWIAKVIDAESGWRPDIPNARGSGAMGLIQFMPETARGLGTTTQELSQMTIMEQLPWVEKYFLKFTGELNSLEDVSAAVFFPAALHMGMDFNIYEWYVQNRGQNAADKFRKQNTGITTMGDYVRKHLA